MTISSKPTPRANAILDAVRRAARQEQFLEVVSAAEARRRFESHIDLAPLPAESVSLADGWLACTCRRCHRAGRRAALRPLQCRRFRRALSRHRRRQRRRAEALRVECRGHRLRRRAQDRSLARHGDGDRDRRRHSTRRRCRGDDRADRADRRSKPCPRSRCGARSPPGNSSLMPDPTSPAARRCCTKARGSARARSGCSQPAALPRVGVVRRPRVAVLSTGDELVAPGEPLRPGGVYDSNGAIIAAAVSEAGGEPVPFGAFPDDEGGARPTPCARALETCDMVVLVGRHLERRGRSVASHRCAARQARHSRSWRRAQARQAAVPGGDRRRRRSSCCRAFRPRRFSPSTLLSRRSFARAPDCRRKRRAVCRRACRCGSPPSSAARNSCWCRWSQAMMG